MSNITNLSSSTQSVSTQSGTIAQQLAQKEDNKKTHFGEHQSDSVVISDAARSLSSKAQQEASPVEPSATSSAETNTDKTAISAEATSTQSTQETEETNNIVASKTFNSGTTVSIHTEAYKEGEEKPNSLMPDQKVMATITNPDGSVETVEITSNTVFSEDENGKFSMTEGPSATKEVDIMVGDTPKKIDAVRKPSTVNGTDGDDLIINLFQAEEIIAGEGNDTIVGFGNNTKLTLGNGNNTIVGGSFELTAGDGDNTATDSTITGSFGNGNNTIKGDKLGTLTFGDGNNAVTGEHINAIKAGNGNNNVDVKSVVSYINLGDGNNTLDVDTLYDNSEPKSYELTSNVRTDENGHNMGQYVSRSVNPPRVHAADINIGNGNNTVSIKETKDEMIRSNINIGDGKNTISVDSLNAILNVGDGDNSFSGTSTSKNSVLNFGDGNNELSFKTLSGRLQFGDGNNNIDTKFTDSGSYFNFGDGNNSFKIDSTVDNISIFSGSGSMALAINGDANQLTYRGFGSNNISIDGSLMNSNIMTGNGDDTLDIKGFMFNSSVDMDKGENGLVVGGAIFNSVIYGSTGFEENDKVFNSSINNEIFSIKDQEDQERATKFYNDFVESFNTNRA